MQIANCPRCGRLFIRGLKDICPQCLEKEEQEFDKVREYLHEHPGAGLQEIEEATGVGADRVLRFLREGRLELQSEKNTLLFCESCGKPIRTGRYCSACARGLGQELERALGKNIPPQGADRDKNWGIPPKMHTADLLKRDDDQ